MGARHLTFPVSIPAGTTEAAAIETMTVFDPGEVYRILVTSPGAIGSGIAIAVAHQIVIPYKGVGWIASTNASQNFTFNPEDLPASGAWSVYGYNTTVNAVSWNVYYDVRPVARPGQQLQDLPIMIPSEVIHQVAKSALTYERDTGTVDDGRG